MLLRIQIFRGFDKNQSYGLLSIYYVDDRRITGGEIFFPNFYQFINLCCDLFRYCRCIHPDW